MQRGILTGAELTLAVASIVIAATAAFARGHGQHTAEFGALAVMALGFIQIALGRGLAAAGQRDPLGKWRDWFVAGCFILVASLLALAPALDG